VFAGKIMQHFGSQLSTPASAISEWGATYNSAGVLTSYLPVGLWLLLVLAAGWSLWRKERWAAVLLVWCFLIILATNPNWLQLPGSGAISNFAILISAYLPAGIFIGTGAGWIARFLGVDNHWWKGLLLVSVVIVLGLWGSNQRLREGGPSQFGLVTSADLRAYQWIQANTPPDAQFLVNTFPAYGNSLIVGSDGGWWLPLLARRQTNLPPLLYSLERGPSAGYLSWINALSNTIYDKGAASPEVLTMLKERQIDYIYIGQQQGSAGYGGPQPLDPALLQLDPHFYPVYHQDRVWIFAIQP
jgi:hypothetical protein